MDTFLERPKTALQSRVEPNLLGRAEQSGENAGEEETARSDVAVTRSQKRKRDEEEALVVRHPHSRRPLRPLRAIPSPMSPTGYSPSVLHFFLDSNDTFSDGIVAFSNFCRREKRQVLLLRPSRLPLGRPRRRELV